MNKFAAITMMVTCLVLSTRVRAESATAKPAGKGAATKPSISRVSAREKAREEAIAQYHKAVNCYMKSNFSQLKTELPKASSRRSLLTSPARADLLYIRKAIVQHRPTWWKKCASPSNISFRAAIWGRSFVANYVPSEMIGVQALVGIKNNKLQIIVSWRPNMIDNPAAAKGYLAEHHKMTKAAIGEAIAWHELGHNYVSHFLPLKHVIALYNDHNILFHHLQEFYADMTALYHCSPQGRLVTMMIRLSSLANYDESEPHTRAGHAIGSLILSHVLAAPDKWPSIHFPAKAPDKNVERNVLIYAYENIDPNWTLAEDKALRDLTKKFILASGHKVLRSKGKLSLPNRLSFRLMVSQDRKYQQQRDAWVARKLAAIIKSGRADKPDDKKTKEEKQKEAWKRVTSGRIGIY